MSDTNILLSIMIETYNQESYISKTLDSILNQEFWFDYEIIIGNDCSTDGTLQILNEYAKKNSKIKIITNKHNLGPMGNYYNLLSVCRGKYLMDCAGDDYWLPNKVRTQIKYMEDNDEVGCCFTKAKCFFQDTNEIKELKMSYKTNFEDLIHQNCIPALTVCLRRTIVEKYINEIKPHEKEWKMEDYPMWLWFSHESKIVFLDLYTAVYRVIGGSVSHPNEINKVLEFTNSINDIKCFYSEFFSFTITRKDLDCSYVALFNDYFRKLSNNYSKEIRENIALVYNKIVEPLWVIKMKYFISRNKTLTKIFYFLKRMCFMEMR